MIPGEFFAFQTLDSLRFGFLHFSHLLSLATICLSCTLLVISTCLNLKKCCAKTKKPTYPDFLARGLWNFSVYGGSRSAAASSQKCDVRDSNSSRSNNTRSGETYTSVQRVRGLVHAVNDLIRRKSDSCEQYFGCWARAGGYGWFNPDTATRSRIPRDSCEVVGKRKSLIRTPLAAHIAD